MIRRHFTLMALIITVALATSRLVAEEPLYRPLDSQDRYDVAINDRASSFEERLNLQRAELNTRLAEQDKAIAELKKALKGKAASGHSKSVMKVGDHALLKKMRPRSMCAALKEMTTDSDNFSLEFLDPNMDNEQKATTLGMVFLLDYMFFERDQDMCHRTPKGGTEFTLCNMYCCGYLHPCKCGGGGGEGGN